MPEQNAPADRIGKLQRRLLPALEVRHIVIISPKFDRTPEPDRSAIEAAGFWIGKLPNWIATIRSFF